MEVSVVHVAIFLWSSKDDWSCKLDPIFKRIDCLMGQWGPWTYTSWYTRICHPACHSVDTVGWQSKMASIEFLIQWCNVHGPNWQTRSFLWSVKACPATLDRWFWVLALPLVVGPPNLQNQLTLTSEVDLNYHGFDRSSQTASFGGEGLEKYNPGKSVCNRD